MTPHDVEAGSLEVSYWKARAEGVVLFVHAHTLTRRVVQPVARSTVLWSGAWPAAVDLTDKLK